MKKILLSITVMLSLFLFACGGGDEADENGNGRNGNEAQVDNKADVPKVPTFNNVSPEVKDGVEDALGQYIKLKNDLVKGQVQDAREHAANLQARLESLRIMELPADQKKAFMNYDNKITEHTARLARMDNLEEQREQFSKIGADIYSMAQSFGVKSHTLYYQYCPMAFKSKGAYWVSESEKIRNPYFGDSMMACGSTRDKLN